MPPGAAFCPVFGGAFTVRFVTFSVVMGDGTDLNGARGADSHGMGNTRPRLLPHARLQAQGPLRRYEHAAVTALNFHDIYNDDPAAASAWLAAIRGLLKPGGVFGVIDHIGNSEADNATLHRIEERLVIDAVEAVGFLAAEDAVFFIPEVDLGRPTFWARDSRCDARQRLAATPHPLFLQRKECTPLRKKGHNPPPLHVGVDLVPRSAA